MKNRRGENDVPEREDWLEYEREKKKLQELHPKEYETAVRELCKRMGV